MEKNTRIILIVAGAFIVVLAGFAGYMFYDNQNNDNSNTNSNVNAVLNINENVNSNNNTNSNSNTSSFVNTNTSTDPNEINVTWVAPQVIENPGIFSDMTGRESEYGAEFYSVGTVNGGKYADGAIIIAAAYPYGPSFSKAVNRFIQKDGEITFISSSSRGLDEQFDETKFNTDDTVKLAGIEFPEKFAGPSSRQAFTLDPWRYALFDSSDLTIAFNDKTLGDVYTTKGYPETTSGNIYTWYGYYIKAPDGTTKVYELTFDFVNDNGIPDVTWDGNVKNELYYSYTKSTGCGSGNYAEVMNLNEFTIADDLKQTGENSFGDPIYELKDTNHQLLTGLYDTDYNPWEGEKISYSEFIGHHPIFFWVDPFDRLIKFKSGEFIPQAECGKPVIYLYPENEQQIDVKVEPRDGMSYSDPIYNSGWSVLAKPNGELTEIATGLPYPYLFWEGNGGIYMQPKLGFVVKQKDVHNFLYQKLRAHGLIDKEIADFVEFWEPRMQGSPYYFVTFLGNNMMDQLAPLTVTPKPDTVIRVLMDFSPLDQPIEVRGYTIKTPKREGFTVVEWGGVIR